MESAAAGGPAHVTVLYPWLDAPVGREQLQELTTVLNDCPAVSLTFDRLERFPSGVLFLALEAQSEQRMRQLSRRLMDAYPDCLPYGGEFPDPHPHLTIAKGTEEELDEIEPQLARALQPLLPYAITATEVVVMEEQSDGRWVQAHRVPLAGP